MNPNIQTFPSTTPVDAVAQNRVLRNTYLLLALSLVPTVLGAFLGVQFSFGLLRGSPFLAAMVFLAVAFGFFFAIEKFKNSAIGVALLLAFTFFMGLWLSQMLQVAFKFKNGGQIIMLAGGLTAVVTVSMAALGTVIKRDLSFMGKFLFIGAVVLILVALANIFLQIPALTLAISALVVMIFSAFIVHDVNQIVMGGETNYVSATLSLYLNIYNVFSGLLTLLLSLTGEKE
jgi:modulator of FtsH protease